MSKYESVKIKPVARRNAACAIFCKAQTFDPSPKRARTRQSQIKKAVKDYN